MSRFLLVVLEILFYIDSVFKIYLSRRHTTVCSDLIVVSDTFVPPEQSGQWQTDAI